MGLQELALAAALGLLVFGIGATGRAVKKGAVKTKHAIVYVLHGGKHAATKVVQHQK